MGGSSSRSCSRGAPGPELPTVLHTGEAGRRQPTPQAECVPILRTAPVRAAVLRGRHDRSISSQIRTAAYPSFTVREDRGRVRRYCARGQRLLVWAGVPGPVLWFADRGSLWRSACCGPAHATRGHARHPRLAALAALIARDCAALVKGSLRADLTIIVLARRALPLIETGAYNCGRYEPRRPNSNFSCFYPGLRFHADQGAGAFAN